eukprot:3480501-Amphidinium_carterae.2
MGCAPWIPTLPISAPAAFRHTTQPSLAQVRLHRFLGSVGKAKAEARVRGAADMDVGARDRTVNLRTRLMPSRLTLACATFCAGHIATLSLVRANLVLAAHHDVHLCGETEN